MSARMTTGALGLALLAGAATDCVHPPPPPCLGAACRQWPHVDVRFFRNNTNHRYTGALCVQVSFDCPEEGRHEVWIEPEAERCHPYLAGDGPEWLKVQSGHLSVPWPARCMGQRVEMYVTAQPNFAVCSAVDNQLIIADRSSLTADMVFTCR